MLSILMVEKRKATILARTVAAVGLSVLLLCLVPPVGLRGHVARYEKYTPTSVKLTLHDTPEIGKPIRVTFNVESDMDLPNVEIEFLAPDGVMFVDTDTLTQTSMKKGETKEFTATAAVVTDRWIGPGGKFIWAVANAPGSDVHLWSAYSVANMDGVIESGWRGNLYADSLRSVRKVRQPSMQEVEEVRDGVGLPENWDYTVVAAHLWYAELRWLWQRGYSREESFEVIQDLARYLARKRGIGRPEATAAIVDEGLLAYLMDRRNRMRASGLQAAIVGITALAVVLIALVGVVSRRARTGRSVGGADV